ncbi:hypothetical protein [Burkholderia gladioli]|uniref:hypothetical protein n=1 Tax=Burkholderia gladioli TaxID=28095 RepID=UPI00163EA61D|nr:hypothetical protein [Burkholderia gladioli]
MTNNTTAELTDDFRGDDANLISSIKALIELNDEGALVPHGIGSHARSLLSAAAVRLTSPRAAGLPEGWKLVPIEPTEKMVNEGSCASSLPGPHYISESAASQCWHNMLDAAPAAPVAEYDGNHVQNHCPECNEHEAECSCAQAVAADGAATDDLLETIDLKAEAGLCAMTHSGTRAFLKDIREIVKTARGAVSPATDDRICTLIPLSDRHPVTDDHPRVIVFTDGSDFNGAQFFDVSADSLNECFYESPDEQPDVSRHATHWMPRPSLHNAAPAPAEPCAHDYVRSDRVCTECGEKTVTAEEVDALTFAIGAAVMIEGGEKHREPLKRILAERAAVSPDTAESKCTRCGASTAQACNDRGCFYLESGEGEPATADERNKG